MRPVGEDEQFYHLDDGKPFKVAKAGLSETTKRQIAQHFANGGQVQPAPAPPPQDPFSKSGLGNLSQWMPRAPAQQFQEGGPVLPAPSPIPPVDPTLLSALAGAAQPNALTPAVPPPVAPPSVATVPTLEEQQRLTHELTPEQQAQFAKPLDERTKEAAAILPPSGAPPVAPAGPPVPGQAGMAMTATTMRPGGLPSLGGGREFAKLSEAETAAIAAQQAQAKVEADRLAAEAEIRNQAQTRLEARTQEEDAKIAAIDARANRLRGDIETSKIDPDHFWSSKDAGGKTASIIGLLLGGIGAGLTKGPNMALEMLNRHIAADIDAQKANLGKKEGLLSSYMKEGYDARQAKTLAMADLRDVAAGQLAANAAKFGGPAAQANAEAAAAAIKRQSVSDRQQVRQQNVDQAYKLSEIEKNQAESMLKVQTAMAGPKEDKELLVPGVGYALDKDAAKTAREALAAHKALKDKLDRLIAMRKEFGSETLPTEAKAKLKSLGAQVIAAANKSEKLGAMDTGTQQMFGEMLGGDPAGYGERLPALEEYRRSADNDFVAKMTPYMDPRSIGGTAGLQTLKRKQAP